MLKLMTFVGVALLVFPGDALSQAVAVTGYSVPAPVVEVVEGPVAAVTTYAAPAVVPSPAVPVVVSYRQPFLRPRTTVVRTVPAPAVVVPTPTVVTYSYPGVLVP